jgi:hypothetical protein
MPEPHEEEKVEPSEGVIRHEDYVTLYANNVQFQPWDSDLRMTFGELDLRKGKVVTEQHTAISISWLQAKIMLYFLGLQVAVQEIANGKIKIPDRLFPPEPTPPSGDFENDPVAIKVYEYIKEQREKFLATL